MPAHRAGSRRCVAVLAARRRGAAISAAELDRRRLDQVTAQVKNASENSRWSRRSTPARPSPRPRGPRSGASPTARSSTCSSDWATASVLFYDLVADKAFNGNPQHAGRALVPGRLALPAEELRRRPALPQRAARPGRAALQEALSRYLDVAGQAERLRRHRGVPRPARGLPSGELPPDIAYAMPSGSSAGRDLTPEERQQRGRSRLLAARHPGQPLPAAVRYYLGRAAVQAQDYPGPWRRFSEVTASKPADERELRSRRARQPRRWAGCCWRPASLDEAVDRYQDIAREAPHFPEALYEMAWAKVKGRLGGSRNATDILLLVAPDSPLAPEAQILQGHLLLKLSATARPPRRTTG